MKRPSPKVWKQTDLALLIGLRALGNDFEFIADRLDCTTAEARGMMAAARGQLRSDLWVEHLLSTSDHEARDETDRVKPGAGVLRKFRVSPHLDLIRAAETADITARLMGDPEPGRGINPSSKEI